MSGDEKDAYFDCSFVSIHYIICECGETFPSENGLKAHLEKEHPHKRERKEFKCGVCGRIYQTEEECITHYEETHIVDIKEEEVEQEVEEEVDVKPSQLVVTAGDGHQYDQHVGVDEDGETQVLHIPEEYGELLQVTPDGQLILMMNPTEGKEAKPRQRRSKGKARVNKDIVCEVCGKKYASNAALKYHQRLHTGERPYHCHLCPKSFAMPLFLQIHVRTHTGERPYQCPECPKAFSNKAALLRHDRVHTGEKPYGCPLCGKSFTQSNSMKLHVATVHLKQPAPYKSKTRKLKALAKSQERMQAEKIRIEEMKSGLIVDTAHAAHSTESEDAARAISSEADVYEVIESEVVSDIDKEVYEVIYK